MGKDAPEVALDVATAKLGVAEDLGWIIGTLSGTIALLKFDSWIAFFVVAFFAYVVTTHGYKKAEQRAMQAYIKHENLKAALAKTSDFYDD